MPELPEVETVCRGLAPILVGRRLARVRVSRRDLRRPLPADFVPRLEGRRIDAVRRRGKYILVELDDGGVLIMHLGMSGRLEIDGAGPPGPHHHVIFETDAGRVIRFSDPRRFGLMALGEADTLGDHPLLAGLGPEPLGPEFDADALARRLAGRRTPIKAALLDQRTVAGLGNIYVGEILYWADISPRRLAAHCLGRRAERLVRATRKVLEEAIAAGGSSLRDYVQPSGELGYFQHRWAVYDRAGEACPRCDCRLSRTGGIRRIVQAGRSTFYCGRWQR